MARSKHKRKVSGKKHKIYQDRSRRLASLLVWHGVGHPGDDDDYVGGIRWPRLTFPPINLWSAPHQPALEDTMTAVAERDDVQEQLCARIDELERDKEVLAAQLDQAEEALAEALAEMIAAIPFREELARDMLRHRRDELRRKAEGGV